MDKPEVIYSSADRLLGAAEKQGYYIIMSQSDCRTDSITRLTSDELDALCAWWQKRNANTSTLTAEERKPAPAGVCTVCHGHGADPLSDNVNSLPCPKCGGSGKVKEAGSRD